MEFKPLYTGSAGTETNENGDAVQAKVALVESGEERVEKEVEI